MAIRAGRTFTFVSGSILLALLASAAAGAAQESPGPRIRTGAMELDIGGRVHAQLNTTTIDTVAPSEWIIRRARIDLRVRINELVSARVMPDFGGDRPSLTEAFARFDFDPGFGVLIGRSWRPFSLIEQTSSTRMFPIERGLRIRGVNGMDQFGLTNRLAYGDRDIGLQLMGAPRGAPLDFAYAVGILAGPLKGRVGNRESHQLAGRVTATPVSPLRVGIGWSTRDFARPSVSPGSYELRRGHAVELDAEYGTFGPGFHTMGEISTGDFDPFEGDRFLGAQGLAGYRTGAVGRWITGIEPMIRVSHGSIDATRLSVSEQGGTLITPGVNFYFGTPNRIMINYDLWSPDGAGSREGSFKTMFQALF